MLLSNSDVLLAYELPEPVRFISRLLPDPISTFCTGYHVFILSVLQRGGISRIRFVSSGGNLDALASHLPCGRIVGSAI
ncbi:hypothetical protein ACJIZ3_022224 [Penstemon smallii]|uniref:Uncharacterized protein n=1 Tax=Penstemon smallii TaxID=265156 RepID=A0ABD3SP96_9LAMI